MTSSVREPTWCTLLDRFTRHNKSDALRFYYGLLLLLCFTVGLEFSSEGGGDASPEARGRRSLLCTPAAPWWWWHTPLLVVWRQGMELAVNTHTHTQSPTQSYKNTLECEHNIWTFNVVHLVFMMNACFLNLWRKMEIKMNIMKINEFSVS